MKTRDKKRAVAKADEVENQTEADKRKDEKPKVKSRIGKTASKTPTTKDTSQSKQKKKEKNAETGEMHTHRVVLRLENVVRARVVSRPSKVVKSPYMADIMVDGGHTEELCHSPALGCAGIIVTGTQVIVTPKAGKSEAKSKYSLDLVDVGPSIIGVNPMMCNKMARKALEEGWIKDLPKFSHKEIRAEVTVDESRFDFKCEKDGMNYFIEVKGVPCACIEDIPMTAKKKEAMMETINKAENKIAYFPDGYRKAKDEVISPRALKHVQHLTKLAAEDNTVCVLLFVVQRQDCVVFQPTHNDPVYREAVYRAEQAGVRILANTVHWSQDGVARWGHLLPLNLHDKEDEF